MGKKRVFFFAAKLGERMKDMRSLLGYRGATLAEMGNLCIPIPAGFTITTDVCREYFENNRMYPKGLKEEVDKNLAKVQKAMGRKYGDPNNPLLLSVRPGARISMPGMMDTILNIGLSEQTLRGLIPETETQVFAYDSYRRFIQMYGSVVMGVEDTVFEHLVDEKKKEKGIKYDLELTAGDWKDLCGKFKQAVKEHTRQDFPEDPETQLWGAIGTAFESWNSRRAIKYRELSNIPHHWGTAVNVQSMVFGNMGDDCATGVAITRDPATGEKVFCGEYLPNSQGEDVVAGIRAPQPVNSADKTDSEMLSLEESMPGIHSQLIETGQTLERAFKDVQDIDFVVERGKLWIVGSRKARRSDFANVRFSIDLLDEGFISTREAIFRISQQNISSCLTPRISRDILAQPISLGLPASQGAVSGAVVFDAIAAEEAGQDVILVRIEVTPEDIGGLAAAKGTITSRGGMTSHAAVVCRGMKKPSVVGADICIDYSKECFRTRAGKTIREGQHITIDGSSGEIYHGTLAIVRPKIEDAPYLKRCAELIWSVDPDEYIDDGLGKLWKLRDTLRDESLEKATPFRSVEHSGHSPERTENALRTIAFVQPPQALIKEVYLTMHEPRNSDDITVAWEIMENLRRMLYIEVGIGGHYLAMRPLCDPQRAIIKWGDKNKFPPGIQLVGMEFFGINRLLRNYLPLASVQWWIASALHDPAGRPWQLDRINRYGESIIEGERDLQRLLVALNDKPLSLRETREFYNMLRKREFGWDWYRRNNTCFQEVADTLERFHAGQRIDRKVVKKLEPTGLLGKDSASEYIRRSLLCPQSALERRQISFLGRILDNDRDSK